MKIFKIILMLILLFSISICGIGSPVINTLGTFDDEIIVTWPWEDDSDQYYWSDIYRHHTNTPATLIEWFTRLTLEEKLEIYNWWKNESVDWKENAIKMPPIIENYDYEDYEIYMLKVE